MNFHATMGHRRQNRTDRRNKSQGKQRGGTSKEASIGRVLPPQRRCLLGLNRCSKGQCSWMSGRWMCFHLKELFYPFSKMENLWERQEKAVGKVEGVWASTTTEHYIQSPPTSTVTTPKGCWRQKKNKIKKTRHFFCVAHIHSLHSESIQSSREVKSRR